jgi:hypothetical protein
MLMFGKVAVAKVFRYKNVMLDPLVFCMKYATK